MQDIEHLLTQCIEQYQGKATEYQLLSFIEQEQPDFFDHLPDKSRLYQRHFWLFHLLYKLKLEWVKSNRHLTISALEISYRLSEEGNHHLSDYDPLTEFYLDDSNLHLSTEEVADMQKKFWAKYLALNEKAAAIKTLGLTGKVPITLKDVKRAFQKLAASHHPDKGGTSEGFSEIKRAYQDLLLLFQ